jgi:hypothetical protein
MHLTHAQGGRWRLAQLAAEGSALGTHVAHVAARNSGGLWCACSWWWGWFETANWRAWANRDEQRANRAASASRQRWYNKHVVDVTDCAQQSQVPQRAQCPTTPTQSNRHSVIAFILSSKPGARALRWCSCYHRHCHKRRQGDGPAPPTKPKEGLRSQACVATQVPSSARRTYTRVSTQTSTRISTWTRASSAALARITNRASNR